MKAAVTFSLRTEGRFSWGHGKRSQSESLGAWPHGFFRHTSLNPVLVFQEVVCVNNPYNEKGINGREQCNPPKRWTAHAKYQGEKY